MNVIGAIEDDRDNRDFGEPEHGASSQSELAYRLQQQELLSEFGLFALRCTNLDETLHQATIAGAAGLNVELCKFLHYRKESNDLFMRAGVGWEPGTVGHATLAVDLESPAGYAFRTGQPILSNHLEQETRFRTPELLIRHGVQRAMNVPVRDEARPHGVLEVDSRNSFKFTQADIAFLQGIANILSVVIERDAKTKQLAEALERERLLGGEMRHRVKNLLTVVNSLIALSKREAHAAGDPNLAIELLKQRVKALGRASEVGLAETDHGTASAKRRFDLVKTAELVLEPYGERVSNNADEPIEIEIDLTTLALLVHEMATNAIKYGALSSASGTVRLDWTTDGDGLSLVWTEAGGPQIDGPPKKHGFGLNLITRLVQSLNGEIVYDWKSSGLAATVKLKVAAGSHASVRA